MRKRFILPLILGLGIFDENDINEAKQFNFNYAVLTTKNAFSCGNLLPSMLKEIGVKVIG